MKCYPIIRGCAFAKVIMGVILVGIAAWIVANPWTLECGKLAETCPEAAMDMLKAINGNASDSLVQSTESAEVVQFCDCFTRCINYITVFEDEKLDANPDNCFTYSQAMGIPLNPVNERRLSTRAYEFVIDGFQQHVLRPRVGRRRLGDGGSVPDLDKDICSSCEDFEGGEEHLFDGLASLSAFCGIALLLTAACELAELKMQSAAFSICIIITDIACAALLVTGMTVSAVAGAAAAVACDPDAIERPIEDAGDDSTLGNPDTSASMALFLTKLLVPAVGGVCDTRSVLTLYGMTLMVGHFAVVVGIVATFCVCVGCTDDGMDATYDDMRATHMQSLHNGDFHH
mmetsp:Transcript_118732/g.335883  ORF Transcript_118732/g.335883 Transcript_118732/m.335883 type:complete len:344 (+) Transcript_118732:130-1161(+)